VIAKAGGERVPLTICDYNAQKGTVSFAFHEVGKTTKELGTFDRGESLFNVTGPLGNPSEIRNYGRVLCVGGSIMIAPMLLQAKALKAAGNHVTTVLGCRGDEFLFM
jgi:ferredoxin--NADP+ reductase